MCVHMSSPEQSTRLYYTQSCSKYGKVQAFGNNTSKSKYIHHGMAGCIFMTYLFKHRETFIIKLRSD